MRVSIIKKNNIKDMILPERIDGGYWISDVGKNGIRKNLISIESDNNRWKLISNNEVYLLNSQQIFEPFVYLEENKFYVVKNETEDTTFLIYCSNNKTDYEFYEITKNLDNGITIGKNEKSFIKYDLVDDLVCYIKNETENINLYVESSYSVYVNNVIVKKSKRLKNGDIIFIMGLKLLFVSYKDGLGNSFCCLGVSKNLPTVFVNSVSMNGLPDIINVNYEESTEELFYPIYDESEYFHKAPRFVSQIKTLELKIDDPPLKSEDNGNSILLTIGPMLTMSMTSLVTSYTVLNNVLNGETSWERALPSLVICAAMFASVFVWPMFSKRYEKNLREKNERKRQKKYSSYIESKRQKIIDVRNEQSSLLKNLYPSVNECVNIILSKLTTLWQRRIEDNDFLDINLGVGSCPMKIDIKYPEEHFSMVEDNLKDMVLKLENEPKTLTMVPIIFSFLSNYISGVVGDKEITYEYTRRLLIQFLAHHSYDELKIVILTNEDNEYQWNFLKTIPHVFSNERDIRFYSSNNDEYKEICYYLDKIYMQRKEILNNNFSKKENFKTFYLIITDTFKKIKNYDFIDSILNDKVMLGFSFLIIDEKITNLPDECSSIIKLNSDNGELINNRDVGHVVKFQYDIITEIDYDLISKTLSNIPIDLKNSDEGQLPSKVGFLEMFDVGKIEQLNALVRWQDSNPILNLSTEVGFDKSGEKIYIDLHEKYHGPHGLIAGMTGSGKSEFIITYILSMAINYHPYEVQFILIDYKGGGLAGAFQNNSIGLKLPHLVGTITNLDENEINRSLASIESELNRRQILFKSAREISGESTIDIYKYQNMYRNGVVDVPVSHLFIICDEFAELKNQQPEFMEQLISTARIGRSLGVHLILSTQKPSGVVNPQIWSNTRFRVCLRVQDKSDSNEVIKCSDAALLKHTGRFYFQVGLNEVFVLGQAAWAGGKYVPADKFNKKIDTSIDFINNVGYIVKETETCEKNDLQVSNNGEESSNIVRYLSQIAKDENIVTKPLWLDKISDFIKIEDLASKYSYTKEKNIINPIVGEYDIPSKQEQRLLTLPITDEGNAIIYGNSGSGKENFITTLIYSSLLYYDPNEVNYYLIDFGSGSLHMFDNCPIVGDILGISDEEKLANLYKLLLSTIESRKKLFANYSGDYETYCRNSGKTVPAIVVIINNFELYQETFEKFDETLVSLSRDSNKYGIYFIITVNTPNGTRLKLKQNFALLYSLQQNNHDDYLTILGNVNKTYPAKIFGRGIIKTDSVYEFQTAMVTEKNDISRYIKEKCEYYSNLYKYRARKVPMLPEVVGYNEIANEFGKSDELIIGLNKESLEISKFNFDKNYITIVSALDLFQTTSFINSLINQIIVVNNGNLVVVNTEDYDITDKYKKLYKYFDKDYNAIFEYLYEFVENQKEKYISSNYNKDVFNKEKKLYCLIIGIDDFKKKLNDKNKHNFDNLFIDAKELDIIDFIIVDSIDKIKNVEFDAWYKGCVSNNSGIWLGNGINEQYSIKFSQRLEEMKKDVPNDFCFVINKGKVEYVKYVSQLNITYNDK